VVTVAVQFRVKGAGRSMLTTIRCGVTAAWKLNYLVNLNPNIPGQEKLIKGLAGKKPTTTNGWPAHGMYRFACNTNTSIVT
jgi:hypothetical protein